MFTTDPADSIAALGEVQLIQAIGRWLGSVSPQSPEGMGDDCAVIQTPANQKLLLSTDSITFGRHFDLKVSAAEAGAKLIKRNLSDIAAMGGQPGHALLNLLTGSDLEINWLENFMVGIRETCERYKLPIVGGDVSSLDKRQFSAVLSLTGHIAHEPLLRNGAQAGDTIYVTGELGGSIYKKHYAFEPRLEQGRWLAQSGRCSAMMDVTDGLAKDLRELIPSQCAAHLDLEKIPLSQDAHRIAAESGRSAMEHAFCDGEDYELLVTVKKETDRTTFESDWAAKFPELRLTPIGLLGERLNDAPYIDAKTKEALPWVKGFEHLKDQ